MTSPVPEQVQAVLGATYTVERELGRGGMATVYLARDTKHGREVIVRRMAMIRRAHRSV